MKTQIFIIFNLIKLNSVKFIYSRALRTFNLSLVYVSFNNFFTHANMKGLGLTPLFGDRRGFMPPQLKTNTRFIVK